jgi:hypothetical protein
MASTGAVSHTMVERVPRTFRLDLSNDPTAASFRVAHRPRRHSPWPTTNVTVGTLLVLPHVGRQEPEMFTQAG